MEIKVFANQEAGPFWGPEVTMGEILGIWKIFLSQTNGLNALIFGMKQPWDKKIQVCANKVPGVINGHTPRKGPKRGNF